jgi:ABC-type branched-subunit amino acid transport system substrate-binding protein
MLFFPARWIYAASAIALTSFAAPAQLTPEETHGREIYRRGTSPSGGTITARLSGPSPDAARSGERRDEVSASVLPCVSCHRADGRGRREGGVVPSNITWHALTRPYGVVHATGRAHPPYTTASLATAITSGTDPAGNPLNAVMPRYRMAPEDLAALIAYVKRLGRDPDPGLSETAVRIGLILPPVGAPVEMRRQIRTALERWFDEANRGGGVFGRRLEPVFIDLPGNPDDGARAMQRIVETERVFAVAASLPASPPPWLEKALVTLARDHEMPVMVPFALDASRADTTAQRYVFAVHAGLRDQAVALAVFADRRQGTSDRPPAAVLVPEDGEAQSHAATSVVERLERLGWRSVQRVTVPIGRPDATALVRLLQRQKIEVILSLIPSPETEVCLTAAAALQWSPVTLVPGSLVGAGLFDVPRAHQARLFAAYPSLPSAGPRVASSREDGTTKSPSYVIAQQTALAAVAVLVEGLRRAGRDVARETVIDALETLDRFETGVTRPVSYRPNRRTGTQGAFIVRIDLDGRTLVPVGEWIEVMQ